jgi:sulfite exporter TauE/SafE
VALALLFFLFLSRAANWDFMPKIGQNMSYGILFLSGLLTSFHCLAMCGGINLSQNLQTRDNSPARGTAERLLPGVLYNAGRVLSYTLIGGVVGAVGSVVAFSGALRGVVAIAAGAFMVLIGLNLSGLLPSFPFLRMPKWISRKVYASGSAHSRFAVGLLNGFMPCGPLQAMQLYALGTGSFLGGASSLLVFGLGTVPLMFLFGAASSFLSAGLTRKMMRAGAVLVAVLGFGMLSQGLSLSGVSLMPGALPAASSDAADISEDVQEITTTLTSGRYAPITVRAGVPVRWTIVAGEKDLNGCNYALVIPKYGIEKELSPGNNTIEFLPEQAGTFPYSCWMGMIRSTITVTPSP